MRLHVYMYSKRSKELITIYKRDSRLRPRVIYHSILRAFTCIDKDIVKSEDIVDQLGYVICNVRRNKQIHDILVSILRLYASNRKYRYVEFIVGLDIDDNINDFESRSIDLNDYLPNIKCVKDILDEI